MSGQGVCPEGLSAWGVCVWPGVNPPPVDRMTDTCENNLSTTTVADGKYVNNVNSLFSIERRKCCIYIFLKECSDVFRVYLLHIAMLGELPLNARAHRMDQKNLSRHVNGVMGCVSAFNIKRAILAYSHLRVLKNAKTFILLLAW